MSTKCDCGTWNNNSAKFCRNCGKKIMPSNSAAFTTKSTSTHNRNVSDGDSGKVFMVIIGVIAIIAGLVLFFMGVISKSIAMGIALGGVGCIIGSK